MTIVICTYCGAEHSGIWPRPAGDPCVVALRAVIEQLKVRTEAAEKRAGEWERKFEEMRLAAFRLEVDAAVRDRDDYAAAKGVK